MSLQRFLRRMPNLRNMLLGRPNRRSLHLHCLLGSELGPNTSILDFLILLENFLQRNTNCLVSLVPDCRRRLFRCLSHVHSLPHEHVRRLTRHEETQC